MKRIVRPVAAALLLPVLGVTALAVGLRAGDPQVPVGPLSLSESPVGAATATVPAPGAAVVVQQSSSARGWSARSADLAGSAEVLDRGLPADVLAAYTTAVLAAPDDCHLSVTLLAALGQVEAGNLAGRQLDSLHRVVPQMIGPALDGTPFQAVPDTDAGKWDGDTTWDRGVGPFHLLPTAWRVAGVDMDGDGNRDPQDVYDAAGAAMVYLCADDRDLEEDVDQREAVLAFNHSPDYLRLVIAWKDLFERADVRAAQQPLTFDAWALPATSAVPARGARSAPGGAAVPSHPGASSGAALPRPTSGVAVRPGTSAATPAPTPVRTLVPTRGPTRGPGTKTPAGTPTAAPRPHPGSDAPVLPVCPLPAGVLAPAAEPSAPAAVGTPSAPAVPLAVVPTTGSTTGPTTGPTATSPATEPPVCVLATDPATGLPYVDPATGLPQVLPTEVPTVVPSVPAD